MDPIFDDNIEQEAEETEEPKSPRRRAKRKTSEDDTDPDVWLSKHDWDKPGMHCKIERKLPKRSASGLRLDGHLDKKKNAPILTDEIKTRWGGGTYHVRVVGPRSEDDIDEGRMFNLGFKVITISGPPVVSEETLPLDKTNERRVAEVVTERGELDEIKELAPAGQVGLLDGIRQAYQGTASNITDAYKINQETIERSADFRIKAAEQAAQARANSLQQQLEDARREAKELRERFEMTQREAKEQVAEASSTATSMLGTIVPMLQTNARDQVSEIVRATTQQITSTQDRAAAEVQQAYRQAELQISSLKAVHEAALARDQASYERQAANYDRTISNLEETNKRLTAENAKLRDQISELMTQRDPMSSLAQFAELKELMEGMGLSGGNDGGNEGGVSDLGEDAPAGLKLLNNFAPVLNNLAEAYKASRGVAPASGPTPEQIAAMQQQQALAQRHVAQQAQQPQLPPAGQVAQAAAGQPKQIAEKTAQLTKDELNEIISHISSAYENNVPMEQIVAVAKNPSLVPQRALVAMTARDPAAVVGELARHGLLPGRLAEPAGQEFFTQLLAALRPAG
jgi:hypothetical protein